MNKPECSWKRGDGTFHCWRVQCQLGKVCVEQNAAGQENVSDGADTEARVRSIGQSVTGDPAPAAPNALADEFSALWKAYEKNCAGIDDLGHFVRLRHAAIISALRQQAGAGSQDTKRMDFLEDVTKCYWVTIQTNPHGEHIYSGQGPAIREAIDAALKERT